MRTLVVSDLHLGTARRRDVLRRPEPREALVRAVDAADRVVLLGDLLELRHGPLREVLAIAEPLLRAIGEPGTPVVYVPGNHDHPVLHPWLERRAEREDPGPLGLDEVVDPGSGRALERVAAALGSATLDVRYPGLWLRDDVYATHGHYLDRRNTVPAFERLAAGVMERISGPLPDPATPDDFEAALHPLYAWLHAVAQARGGAWSARGQGQSAELWQILSPDGEAAHRPLKARALARAFPVGVAALNAAGLGPVGPDLSGAELRRSALRAMGDVVRRLGLRAEHVVFGHTHRAGPLPADDPAEWRTPTGARLHNPGCWIDEPVFARGGAPSPYYAGRALLLDDGEAGGAPELVRLTDELGQPPPG